MKNSTILLEGNPKGRFEEGIIDDTSKPGTIMQVVAASAEVSGRKHWIAAASGTDGKKVLMAVLLDDIQQGVLYSTAYVAGTRCRLYFPVAGEELNLLAGEVAGTGNSYAVGDRLIVDGDDGILVPETGSPQTTVAVAMEAVTAVAGSGLLWVKIM